MSPKVVWPPLVERTPGHPKSKSPKRWSRWGVTPRPFRPLWGLRNNKNKTEEQKTGFEKKQKQHGGLGSLSFRVGAASVCWTCAWAFTRRKSTSATAWSASSRCTSLQSSVPRAGTGAPRILRVAQKGNRRMRRNTGPLEGDTKRSRLKPIWQWE